MKFNIFSTDSVVYDYAIRKLAKTVSHLNYCCLKLEKILEPQTTGFFVLKQFPWRYTPKREEIGKNKISNFCIVIYLYEHGY